MSVLNPFHLSRIWTLYDYLRLILKFDPNLTSSDPELLPTTPESQTLITRFGYKENDEILNYRFSKKSVGFKKSVKPM